MSEESFTPEMEIMEYSEEVDALPSPARPAGQGTQTRQRSIGVERFVLTSASCPGQ